MTSESSKKCLVVLGMHRSGTSALAGILALLGVDLGKEFIPPLGTNPRGFFENRQIYRANEVLLKSLHSSWEDPLLLPDGWWQHEQVSRHKKTMITLIANEFEHSNLFGIKDPRICSLLPFWRQLFEQLSVTPFYLIMLRNPLEVAASLEHREHFSLEKSVTLWMNAMFSAERDTRGQPRAFIAFDDLLAHPQQTITSISQTLSLRFPKQFQDIAPAIHQFLTPRLKHYRFTPQQLDRISLPEIAEYYRILSALSHAPNQPNTAFEQIDRLREQYYTLSRWFYHKELRSQIQTFYKKDSAYNVQELSTQLLIDTGSGFTEDQALMQKISGYERSLTFDLSHYKDIQHLEFRPLNRMVVLRLNDVTVMTGDERRHRAIRYSTNALYHENHLFVFETDHPMVSIDLQGFRSPKTLVIHLTYLAWERERYQTLLMSKEAKISQQARYIQTMEQTLSWRMTKPIRIIRNHPRFAYYYTRLLKYLRQIFRNNDSPPPLDSL